MENTVSSITEGIRVSVRHSYQVEQSSPQQHYYLFAYEVEIRNESRDRVQLLSREWHITDGVGNERLVQGEGVIGKQPILEPGASHQYVSYCDFKTFAGRMAGYYFMYRFSDGASLRITIPEFEMVAPFIQN